MKDSLTKRLTSFAIVVMVSLACTSAYAQQSLMDLYKQVEKQASAEAQHNNEREQRFLSSAEEQKQLLADVEANIRRQEALKTELKTAFDTNEDRLAELSTVLDRRIGDLGELFGVFRQTADDTQTLLFDSLITVEHPQRRGEIEALASSNEQVPSIPEMQSLWRLLMHEIVYSGQLSGFESEIVAPEGTSYSAKVVRVGTFNVVSGDKYLSYLAEENKITELPRQPVSYARRSADELTSASNGTSVNFALDPSRGALLGLLVQSPSIIERVQQGKTVGYLIIAVALIGLGLVVERFFRLSAISRRINKQLNNLDQVSTDNPLGRIMEAFYENQHLDDLEVISRKLETIVIADVADVKKGLSVIKVFAAVAPLMGLLGTVAGMIETFQMITLFGTGDPKLMAGGISTALITTVLGLCAAIPLLLSHSFLNSKSVYLSKLIGEQAAGLMAQKAKEIAVEKTEGAPSPA